MRAAIRQVLFGQPVPAWTPYKLFSAGEQGAWYDPSDWTTLFQDSAGTTPVTAVEQPVGLMLDKSKGLVLGSELVTVAADRDFSSDTGFWMKEINVTISGGKANWNNATLDYALYRDNFISANTLYDITFTVSNYTAGGIKVYAAGSYSSAISANGTYTIRIKSAATAGVRFGLFASATGTNLSIDDVSIKQVTGNHAFQAVTLNRPILSARKNMLVGTATLSTQTAATIAGPHVLSFWGTGSVTLSGTATGTLTGTGANDRVYLEFTATTGTLTLTVSGSVTKAQLEMANEPV